MPSSFKSSKLSHRIFCTFRSRDNGIFRGVPILLFVGRGWRGGGEGERGETSLLNVSHSHWGLECPEMKIPARLFGGTRFLVGILAAPFKALKSINYESTFPPLFQRFSLKGS